MSELFKGIAVFTPGGDVVYCIDPSKQRRWHIDLCTRLQTLFDLSAPPHFLVPCYTATIDRWFNPQTQQIECIAEAYPFVFHYHPFLNAIFNTPGQTWTQVSCSPHLCDPMAIATYYHQFPQLWDDRDWVVRIDAPQDNLTAPGNSDRFLDEVQPEGYVFRLFITGTYGRMEHLLRKVHDALEQTLSQPYTLKVIDILKHPDLAERDRVLATPTLLRVWPKPVRRVVGEIEVGEQLLSLLS